MKRRNFVRLVGGAFGAALIAGCSSAPPPPPAVRWTSNNQATQERWLSDRNACYIETQQQMSAQSIDQSKPKADGVDGPVCRTFNACLAARGYIRSDATGYLTVPAGASVVCATPNT